MTATADTGEIEKRARALLDTRINAVRALATTRADLATAREALERADAADTRAYTAAIKAGWTEPELKTVGFDAPTRRAPGRPRGTRAKTTAPDNAPPAQDGAPADADTPTTS
jgi:hypothetical protein